MMSATELLFLRKSIYICQLVFIKTFQLSKHRFIFGLILSSISEHTNRQRCDSNEQFGIVFALRWMCRLPGKISPWLLIYVLLSRLTRVFRSLQLIRYQNENFQICRLSVSWEAYRNRAFYFFHGKWPCYRLKRSTISAENG